MSYQVKIVRLLGNQDVIAKVEVRRQDGRVLYKLSDVLGLMVVPDEEQSNLTPTRQPRLRVQLYPFLAVYMNSKKTIELDQFHVLFVSEPASGILDYYNQQTSGLILPKTADAILPAESEEAPIGPEVKLEDVPVKSDDDKLENDIIKIPGSGDFNQS